MTGGALDRSFDEGFSTRIMRLNRGFPLHPSLKNSLPT